MANTGYCKICRHPRVQAINNALLQGMSLRKVAKEFNLGYFSAAQTHKNHHLPKAIERAVLHATTATREEMRPEVDALLSKLWDIFKECPTCREAAWKLIDEHRVRATTDAGIQGPSLVDRPSHPQERTGSHLRAL